MYRYLLLAFSIFLVCCSDSNRDCDDFNPEFNEFHFTEGALDISDLSETRLNVQVVDGKNLVFDYIHEEEDCINVIDDEVGSRVRFELDPNVSSISLTDEELQNINCVYYRTGAWANVSFRLTEGQFEAQKISETEWQVSLSSEVNRYNINEFSIDEVFTLR